MPDPPKTKTMAPPPPRLSVSSQQKANIPPEQASSDGAAPDALLFESNATSEKPTEPSTVPKVIEAESSNAPQSPATASILQQAATKPGAAYL